MLLSQISRRRFLRLAPLGWALSPLLARADDLASGGVKTLRDLPYVTNGHEKQKLDLFLPKVQKGPLVINIHGGGWSAGSKSQFNPAGMLSLGYATASVEYRF